MARVTSWGLYNRSKMLRQWMDEIEEASHRRRWK